MNRGGWCTAKTYLDPATYVFLFLVQFNTINMLRYILTLYDFKWYVLLVNYNLMTESLLMFQVCNLFVQKSIDKNNESILWVKTSLNIVLLLILGVYITGFVIELINEK